MPGSTEPITQKLTEVREKRGGPGVSADGDTLRREKESGFSRGVNLEPGSDDDGWEVPPPVTLSDGTRLQLYKDGEALAAAMDAIRHAREQILLEVYIWPSDETGWAFADLLCEKARAGVAVYAIYDGFGSLLAKGEMFEKMRRAGVRLIEFHPAFPWASRYSWRPANRDHRKLLVVDGHIAGLGGLNIGNRYAGSWVAKISRLNVEKLWRDAAVGIVGPGARPFVESFRRTWRYCLYRGSIENTLYFDGIQVSAAAKGARVGKAREDRMRQRLPVAAAHPDPHGRPDDVLRPGCDLAPLATSPTLSSPLRPFLHRLLRNARHSITMTMAYFAPDDELIDGLCQAGRRGVRLRLMFARYSDVAAVSWAGRAFYDRLMDAGAEIYEREHVLLHQKSIAIDHRLSVLGSTNLDYRSIEFNLELSAVIRSEHFARQLEALFDHDVQFSRRIDPSAWRRRPWRDRFIQWAISRMRYVL